MLNVLEENVPQGNDATLIINLSTESVTFLKNNNAEDTIQGNVQHGEVKVPLISFHSHWYLKDIQLSVQQRSFLNMTLG